MFSLHMLASRNAKDFAINTHPPCGKFDPFSAERWKQRLSGVTVVFTDAKGIEIWFGSCCKRQNTRDGETKMNGWSEFVESIR